MFCILALIVAISFAAPKKMMFKRGDVDLTKNKSDALLFVLLVLTMK